MTDGQFVERGTLDLWDDTMREQRDRIGDLTEERDRLREALRDGRRLLAIAQDDRIRLLIQIEQCEKRHD